MSTTPPISRREARANPADDRPQEAFDSPEDVAAAEAKAAKRAKAERIGRVAAIFIMPLLIVGMMITGYLSTMHSPTPHDMPIAVVGSASATGSFMDALDDAEGDGVATERVDSAAEAREMVINREAVAAVVIDGDAATLYTATAAGASQASLVTGLISPVVLDEGLTLESSDLVPLPDNDMSGLGAMFLTTALVMAGYLPFSTLRSNSPELLKFRRIVPLLAAWAALIAGVVWLVTGPILEVVTSEYYLPVLGVAWLGVFAIACVQLFITRLFGSLGVIVGMLLLMVLGMPSSNMSMSVYTMPPFFRTLHDFLPMPAIGESMRSVLYFGGAGVTGHLLVLAIGAVAGLLATAAFDARNAHKHVEGVPTDVTIPSLHGGPRQKGKFWRYASVLTFPLVMVAMMITCMLGAMHQPSPRDVPVAVVGSTIEQAEQTIAGLEENMDGLFELTPYVAGDEDEVRSLVEDRDLVAALVLPSQTDPEFRLVANQAGSASAYQVVVRVFTQVAGSQQMALDIDDVAPLPDRDSQGVATMYIAMGWILAGFIVVIVAANAAPHTRPLRRMLPITAVYSMFMSAVLWMIAAPITGAIVGHFWPLWGAGVVAIFSVAMVAMVFERLIGMFAVIPVVLILMFAGVPSSNGAFSMYLAPEWFRTLHDFLPMPAAVEVVRSILYFGGDVVAQHLEVLAIWGLVSLALVFVIDSLKPVRTEHDFGDAPLVSPTGPDATTAVSDEQADALRVDSTDASDSVELAREAGAPAGESERELEPVR